VNIVATYSIKGGVGKTSAAVNLGYLAARAMRRTLIWDLDPQGGATYLFRVRPIVRGGGRGLIRRKHPLADAVKATDYDLLDLLPADFSYRHLDLELDAVRKPENRLARLMEPLAEDYDLVLLDCPPSVSLISESVCRAADVLVVPVIPAPLSVRTLAQLTDFVDSLPGRSPAILPFLSMADPRRPLHREAAASLPGAPLVPASAYVERMGDRRAPLAAFAPNSPAAAAYEKLWAALADLLDP
jgi:cellulose biosynthesis protein BcsQ